MRLRTFTFIAVVFCLLSSIASADILKLVLNDTIQASTAERVQRAIDEAAARKDEAVLIELSTPRAGGPLLTARPLLNFPHSLTTIPLGCSIVEKG